MKFLTFGEIMLRLKAPGQECFFQSPMLEATFGGGEANVAVSLANYGEDAAFPIAELTEDLEELRSEKALLFQKLEYAEIGRAHV